MRVCTAKDQGYFYVRSEEGGLTPKFASEIRVGAPNFASKNTDDVYPKSYPLNFRSDSVPIFGSCGTRTSQVFPLIWWPWLNLAQILPPNLRSGPSLPDLLRWKSPPGSYCSVSRNPVRFKTLVGRDNWSPSQYKHAGIHCTHQKVLAVCQGMAFLLNSIFVVIDRDMMFNCRCHEPSWPL